ncbi:hypothetical protein V1515DRAFT_580091 [Lipomyces mesembrius]
MPWSPGTEEHVKCEPVWPLLLTWAAEEFQDDAELRGLLAAVVVTTVFDVIDFIALLAFFLMSRYDRKKKGLVLNSFGLVVNREEYLANLEEQSRWTTIDKELRVEVRMEQFRLPNMPLHLTENSFCLIRA